jgi:hypothetical protein
MSEGAGHNRRPGQSDPSGGAPKDPWRIPLVVLELGGLYFVYTQNEGAAFVTQALVMLIRFRRR